MIAKEAVLGELEAGRDRIAAEEHWCRGTFDHVGNYCAVGALYQGDPRYGMARARFPAKAAAESALTRTLVIFQPWLVPVYALTFWSSIVTQLHNDHTDHWKVIRNYDRTIRRYRFYIEAGEAFEPTRLLMMGEGWREPLPRRRGRRVPSFVPVPTH